MLGWPPAAFWAATPIEFWAAFGGWRRVNCIRGDTAALNEEEVERLEDMRRRFPDERPVRC